MKRCEQCGTEFEPKKKAVRFCSYKCSNTYKWKHLRETRVDKIKKMKPRLCLQCGNEYRIPESYSIQQYTTKKFCSNKCAGIFKTKNDGTNKCERWRRKNGISKQGSGEWLEKIKAKTKEGMYRPDVQEKIRKPKGPMSEERKIQKSNALAGRMPKNLNYPAMNTPFPNVRRGTYFCSKGDHYFRSKWEANYALYLDFLVKQNEIEKWEYEADTFWFDGIEKGTRTYTPDFKIFNFDDTIEYHEVKGYMTPRAKTQLKRMEKYHPDTKLILIDGKFYNELYRKMKGLIKFN